MATSKSHRGVLLVLVMVLLCFFGALAGTQVLIHASAGLSSRALDLRRQRIVLGLRVERALSEALLGVQESGMGNGETLAAIIEGKLAQLDHGDGRVNLAEGPTSTPIAARWFPGTPGDPLLPPSVVLLSAAPPDLRQLMGSRITECDAGVFRFSCEQATPSAALNFTVTCEARLVAVPLTRLPLVAYDLPHEVGRNQEAVVLPVGFRTMGLVSSRDSAAQTQLTAFSEAQLYHFRRRVSEALAYQRLFSQASVDALAAAAGSTHVLNLGIPEASSPALAGLTRSSDGASFDVAQAGPGSFGGTTEDRSVSVIFSSVPNQTLRILDSGGAAEAEPLILLAMGSSSQPLAIEIGTLSRPLLLIAITCGVRILQGSSVQAALFLSPGCSLTAPGVSVSHLSVHAGSPYIDAPNLGTGPALPLALESLCPRVVHVVVWRSDS